ncbi:MAG: hypothetical protein Q9178_005067 [Gyalolechia marmorata]
MSFCSQYASSVIKVPQDPHNCVDIGRYAFGMDIFDYDLNVTRCTDTRTLCPNNNFSASNETCCERNQGITEINYQNNEPLPAAKADLSSYYALAGLTIPTDGVYKTATATTSTFTAATSSSPSTSPTTTVARPNTSTDPSPPPTPSSGLSTGAKAGIGAGAAVGVLIIAAAAIFLWIRRRRRRTLPHETEKPELFGYPQYSGVPQGHQVAELGPAGDFYKSSELPDDAVRIELDSQTCGPGSKKSSEMREDS